LAVIIIIELSLIYKSQIIGLIDRLRIVDPQERATRELFQLRSSAVKNEEDITDMAGKAISLARKSATTTPVVEIQFCSANPSVVKLKYGEQFTFKNTGSDTELLSFPGLKMNLESGQSLPVRTTEISRPSKNEAYTLVIYTCAGKQGPAGYIYIED